MRRVLAVLFATASIVGFVGASEANAYLHLENCQYGLRMGQGGDVQRDDDIHNYGVTYGYSAWGGWAGYTRNSSTSLQVYFWMYKWDRWNWRSGNCSGNDGYFNDWISYNY